MWLNPESPDPGDAGFVRLWVLVYVVTVLGGVAFGPKWFDRADPFDVCSAVVANLSPVVRDGRLVLHKSLRTLPQELMRPGLVAVLAILLGSTACDSFSASAFRQGRALGDPGTQDVVSQHPSLLAGLKVTLVVAGHVLAVVAALDRALAPLLLMIPTPSPVSVSSSLSELIGSGAFALSGCSVCSAHGNDLPHRDLARRVPRNSRQLLVVAVRGAGR